MISIPTLGPDNYVTDVKQKLSYAFMHMLEARHSDDAVFEFETISLQYYIMQYPKDPVAFASAVEGALNKYMLRQFDNAEIAVTAVPLDSNEDTFKVTFSGRVNQQSTWHDFSREITVSPTDGIKRLDGVFSFGGGNP